MKHSKHKRRVNADIMPIMDGTEMAMAMLRAHQNYTDAGGHPMKRRNRMRRAGGKG